MTAPVRIQRKRIKGWRAPAGAIYVGRGTLWGNPFKVGQQYMPAVHPHEVTAVKDGCFTRFFVDGKPGIPLVKFPNGPLGISDVISLYRGHAAEQIGLSKIRQELRGKDLMCWCAPDRPCHADILLELANKPICEAS